MNELPLERFHEAIRHTHGAESKLRERVQVREGFGDQAVWKGEVLVFELAGHETANRCYAWSVGNRVTAVLHEGPIDSPEAAVRAAIVAEHQTKS